MNLLTGASLLTLSKSIYCYNYYFEKPAWDVESHSLHVKVLDFAPFVVRMWGNSSLISHSNPVNRDIKITHAHNLWRCWTLALLQFLRKKTQIAY